MTAVLLSTDNLRPLVSTPSPSLGDQCLSDDKPYSSTDRVAKIYISTDLTKDTS